MGLRDVSLVTVLYNSAAVIDGLLSPMRGLVPSIAVENASQDDGSEIAAAAGAKIVHLTENVGFGCGCNHGANVADTDFILFINPDARISVQSLDFLRNALLADPQLFAVGPILIESGERRQKTANHIDQGLEAELKNGPTCLSGSCFLVRRAFFSALGGFDPNIFLFYEEDDLFFRARQRGWKLAVVDEATAEHAHGGSSRPSRRGSWLKAYHGVASRLYVAEKYGLKRSRLKEGRRAAVKIVAGLASLSTDRLFGGLGCLTAAIKARPGATPHPLAEPMALTLRRSAPVSEIAKA